MYFALIHRKYKENNEVPSIAQTGRVIWTLWRNPTGEEDCPPIFGWDFEPLVAGDVPDLDRAVYMATVTMGGDSNVAPVAVWYLPGHRAEVEIPDGYVTEIEYEATVRATHGGIVDEAEKAAILEQLTEDMWEANPPDLYFVRDPDTGDWDLYSISGRVPEIVYAKFVGEDADGNRYSNEYSARISFPADSSADPGFAISPPTFAYGNNDAPCFSFGALVYDSDVVAEVLDARYDGECDGEECLFFTKKEFPGTYFVYTSFTESELEFVEFKVPLYIKYLNAVSGTEDEVRKEFTVYARSSAMVSDPYVKYVRNLATRVGSYEKVDILGGNFAEGMNVRLSYGTDWSTVVPHSELVFGKEGVWDTISFVMNPDLAMKTTGGEEACAAYDLQVGYGDGAGFIGLAGSGDAKMAMENNIGLIRYKYDADTMSEQKKASAGTVVTTNAPCFYATDIGMVYDSTDSRGNATQNGGASGKYGKTIYWKVDPSVDCESVRYVRVKLKYNKRLDYRKGQMVLDGVNLVEGDIVWLAGQMDGTDGLWVVQSGEWDGLRDYLEPAEYSGKAGDPCIDPEPVPLEVDGSVFVDLGARVDDKVDYRCAEDVPEKYGIRTVCGYTVKPGDIILLGNQSTPGHDGLWEVTCAEWIYRGAVNDNGTTSFDASDMILTQNNIDFCACANGASNPIYNIEYYYLNAACYLASAVRKVKMLCSSTGGLFPNNRVVVTDYSITVGAEKELVVDTGVTAGDGEAEDCTKPNDNFEQANGDNVGEVTKGCGQGGSFITAPDCKDICDCPRYYLLDRNFDSTSVQNGFSMVFWQFGEGGWHLYGYVQQKGGGASVAYYVYHLHVCGIATVDMVDENTDVYIVGDDGIPTSKRTKDAWFVRHGGVLADGFGMYDENWTFVVQDVDENGNPVYDENGMKVTHVSHELDADTLFQNWVLHAPSAAKAGTKMLAHAAMVGEMESAEGMAHTYGFRFYHTPLSKERFCQIYNESKTGCVCQQTWNGLATDQCYDSDGMPTDCGQVASEGSAFITTDSEEVISTEKACFDDDGQEIECK